VLTALRAAAVVEAASLLLLVVNLLTLHVAALASMVGPLHGSAYLAVIATTFLATGSRPVRLKALIPGVGGLLAVRAAGATPRGDDVSVDD
jgi:hypothetical protein